MTKAYQDTIDYLFKQLPMYQRDGAPAMKKDLKNIQALCTRLEYPHAKFPSIHIAGTNGKGSVSHMLSAVLQEKGLKVGLYTSPHYRDFRERVKINGALIPEEKVVDFVNKNRVHFDSIQPSFFEISVAMAFDYFAKEKVDIAIIETGLGGRLDSTNIITPIMGVITNISLDHQEFLGDTLAEIATEKAGIIKRNIPIVIGQDIEETRPIFEKKAKDLQAEIYFAEDTYGTIQTIKAFTHSIYNIYKFKKLYFRDVESDIAGAFQAYNVNTAIQAINVLNTLDYNIREEDFKSALLKIKKTTNFMGRCHLLGHHPLILADSAHNEAGIKKITTQIASKNYAQEHFVLGFVSGKDVKKILSYFPKGGQFYFAKPNIPRGKKVEEVLAVAKEMGLNGAAYPSVEAALEAAKAKAQAKDLIYVGGSTFVVAELV